MEGKLGRTSCKYRVTASPEYRNEKLSALFQGEKKSLRPAVERMIAEADALAASGQRGPTLDELFGEE